MQEIVYNPINTNSSCQKKFNQQVEECFVTGCGGEEGNGKVRLCDDIEDDVDHNEDDDFYCNFS